MFRSCITALASLGLVLLCAACQPQLVPATGSIPSPSPVEVQRSAVRLPALPKDEPITVQLGQRLVLPTRTPSENWQLDYDPRYWQRTEDNLLELIAINSGETEVVQRERTGRGGPAPRRFVYRLHISP